MTRFYSLVLLCALPGLAGAQAPWATYRGNAERTGCTDGKPGPAQPKLLWVYASKDHHIAAPVPFNDKLFVSGFGGFNVAHFNALSTLPKPAERMAWTLSLPYLKQATVSSPAVVGNRIIFGDGMHQNDGGTLYCLLGDTGLPQWQLPLLGKLIHLESTPTVVDDKLYMGGGNAGVFCLDINKLTLQGKVLAPAEVDKALAVRWKELWAKYEVDVKKDPDFTLKPSIDDLPKANPQRVWQIGQNALHVDAPITVVGDKVLACSAFLDKEQFGDRAVHCLDNKDGKKLWRTPLKYNPWGGATVAGDTIIVGGSSISYDLKALKVAKGEITALNLSDGKVKWQKPLNAGILSNVAVADGLAVATATDGKVRAYDVATGEQRWGVIYDAKAPIFAPPTIVGGVVYVGDLQGVVHAIQLKTGVGVWKLDISAETKTPGMIYGGPIVHGGNICVATCNLEGPNVGAPTVVVCIGHK